MTKSIEEKLAVLQKALDVEFSHAEASSAAFDGRKYFGVFDMTSIEIVKHFCPDARKGPKDKRKASLVAAIFTLSDNPHILKDPELAQILKGFKAYLKLLAP